MSSLINIQEVQALYERYLVLKNRKDELNRKRDDLLTQNKVSEEQLVAVYGKDWEAGYETELAFLENFAKQMSPVGTAS